MLLPALPSQFIPHVRSVCVCIYVLCECVCVWFHHLTGELHLMTAAGAAVILRCWPKSTGE